MMSFKTIVKHNSIRLIILFLSTILFTIIVNSFHPTKLPLVLAKESRPGIPEGSWQEKIRFINAEDMAEKISSGQIIIIDLRDSEAFDELHAVGSINIPYYEFEEVFPDFMEQISREQSIFLLCEGMLCGLSTRVAKEFLDSGYDNLSVIKQGFDGWKKRHLPMNSDVTD
ncbi:rhodanese-like domain-containing protein [Bacteroidota bacterium]